MCTKSLPCGKFRILSRKYRLWGEPVQWYPSGRLFFRRILPSTSRIVILKFLPLGGRVVDLHLWQILWTVHVYWKSNNLGSRSDINRMLKWHKKCVIDTLSLMGSFNDSCQMSLNTGTTNRRFILPRHSLPFQRTEVQWCSLFLFFLTMRWHYSSFQLINVWVAISQILSFVALE